MVATEHAKERWAERFPELNIETEYAASKCIGNGKVFQAATAYISKGNLDKLLKNGTGGTHYMLVTKRSNAVFVMDKGEIIITVMKLPC